MVYYIFNGQKLLNGRVQVNAEHPSLSGILCSHCGEVVSCSAFEAHAGGCLAMIHEMVGRYMVRYIHVCERQLIKYHVLLLSGSWNTIRELWYITTMIMIPSLCG